MAVGDVYRLQFFLDTQEGDFSFCQFYRETFEPTTQRPPDELIDAWWSMHWMDLLDSLSIKTQVNCIRATRILPDRGIPAQTILSVQFGHNPESELALPCGARYLVHSVDAARRMPNWFMLSGIPWSSAGATKIFAGPVWTALGRLATAFSQPLFKVGLDGRWEMVHLSRTVPNGVNSYGTPTSISQVTVDARPRIERGRALSRKGAVLPV